MSILRAHARMPTYFFANSMLNRRIGILWQTNTSRTFLYPQRKNMPRECQKEMTHESPKTSWNAQMAAVVRLRPSSISLIQISGCGRRALSGYHVNSQVNLLLDCIMSACGQLFRSSTQSCRNQGIFNLDGGRYCIVLTPSVHGRSMCEGRSPSYETPCPIVSW